MLKKTIHFSGSQVVAIFIRNNIFHYVYESHYMWDSYSTSQNKLPNLLLLLTIIWHIFTLYLNAEFKGHF